MKLGIIGAMDVEVAILKEKMTEKTVTTVGRMDFCEGKLSGCDVVIAQGGVGKVHAAMCAQTLCDRFAVTHLVNTGIAGSLCADLDIGDLVVSTDAMYHDFDCVNFGYPMGQVPGMDTLTFPADKAMIDYAFAAAETVNHGHTKKGRIATGDQFVAVKELKDRIIANTQGLCTEMEGAAIAQTAYRNKVPFVILRAISDKADNSATMDYPTFERNAAYHCAEVTKNLARQLKNI